MAGPSVSGDTDTLVQSVGQTAQGDTLEQSEIALEGDASAYVKKVPHLLTPWVVEPLWLEHAREATALEGSWRHWGASRLPAREPQRITEPIWSYCHSGAHSAEPLRLGKQTLCQLSYSRMGPT
jgi:hypothetical protein